MAEKSKAPRKPRAPKPPKAPQLEKEKRRAGKEGKYVEQGTFFSRLQTDIHWSIDRIIPFRDNRNNLIRDYTGMHYGDEGSDKRMPVNRIELAVSTMMALLVGNEPRALVTTPIRKLKPTAYNLKLALEMLSKQMLLGDTLGRCTRDALLSPMGIIKIGLERGRQIELNGVFHDVGQPFAGNVDFEDWVHDMRSNRLSEARFMCNRYVLPVDAALDSGLFPGVKREDFSDPDESHLRESARRISSLTKGNNKSHKDSYKDLAEFWDVWLPEENAILTFSGNLNGKPLREIEYQGPEGGPFHFLWFNEVPGNSLPLPPASQWADLNSALNSLYRKNLWQASNSKTVLAFEGGARSDAEAIINADDTEAVQVNNPDRIRELSFNGVDPQSHAFFLSTLSALDQQQGNMPALAGLGPQSGTVGQDKIITESANRKIADMQKRAVAFTSGVFRSLAWWLWTDPDIDMPLIKTDGAVSIQTRLTPSVIDGEFLDYNFDIDPYSLQYNTPQEKMQAILTYFQSFLLPLMPQLEAQGTKIEFDKLTATYAEYMNLNELNEMVSFNHPRDEAGVIGDEGPGKPSVTTRNVNRTSTPGASVEGQRQVMQAALQGNASQDANVAAMAKTPGQQG